MSKSFILGTRVVAGRFPDHSTDPYPNSKRRTDLGGLVVLFTHKFHYIYKALFRELYVFRNFNCKLFFIGWHFSKPQNFRKKSENLTKKCQTWFMSPLLLSFTEFLFRELYESPTKLSLSTLKAQSVRWKLTKELLKDWPL